MTRRELFEKLIALTGLALASTDGFAEPGKTTSRNRGRSEGRSFSLEWLREEARRLAKQPYVHPKDIVPDWINKAGTEGYDSIRFKPENSLWMQEKLPFQVRLFHPGNYFRHSVSIFDLNHGVAEPVLYSKNLFSFGAGIEVPANDTDIGFAGFRVQQAKDVDRDVFSFLGASYFRAVGGTMQYGISARGLAVDTALSRPEEFPEFRSFWLERPAENADHMNIYALLDSESITGAYVFNIKPGDTTVMEIEAWLFPRKPMDRIGLAPLTSMYQYGENDRRVSDDFRPEIHDSDGLSIQTGSGEWIWRPLVNSPVLRVNSFMDNNPKGFGLLQRDRNFDHYQDDGLFYHQRPSVWVEPHGDWGKGAVQLVEIPTIDENFDNIVAYWSPEETYGPGQEHHISYRLSWGSDMPVRSGAAEVIATRIGTGGPISRRDRPPSRKFVIDFEGGRLNELPDNASINPVISVSRGEARQATVRPVRGSHVWRCTFDLFSDGREPIDLRCYLSDEKGALTETWLYQWTPSN